MDGFANIQSREVLFYECPFSSLRYEGAVLFAMHWLEASANHAVPLDVNWQAFEALEAAGAEVCVAVRSGGMLVGYAVYIVHPHLHYRHTVIADSDAFFLRPADRHGAVGIKLFRVAEDLLRQRGVHEVHARVKKHVRPGRGRSDLGPLFVRLGYTETETTYRKWIG